jgi:menaquinone-dependent protoporphyrinogen oxidase
MTVLVGFSSRHGATAEIAEAIGAALVEHGVAAEVADVEQVDGLSGYDAVVLGSAIYMGRWTKPAAAFVDLRGGELRDRPVWLFSSGPIGDPPKPEAPDTAALEAIVAATGAREHRLFAGRLDKSRLGLKERAAVRFVGAPEGDFRDWEAIREWAREIAREVRRS